MHGGLDQYRLRSPRRDRPVRQRGRRDMRSLSAAAAPGPWNLLVIASADAGWDHVSVSRQAAMPTYDDLTQVVQLFFERTRR